eukprot:60314_1
MASTFRNCLRHQSYQWLKGISITQRRVHLNAPSIQHMDTQQEIFRNSFAEFFNEWRHSSLHNQLSDILQLQHFDFSICKEDDFDDILSFLELHHITYDNALHIFDPHPKDMTSLIYTDLYNNCYFLGRGIVVRNALTSEICGYYSVIDAADFLYPNSYKHKKSTITHTLTAKHIAEVVGNVVTMFFDDLKRNYTAHGVYARGSWFTVHQKYRQDTAISFMLRNVVWHLMQKMNYQNRIGISSNRLTTAQKVHQYHPLLFERNEIDTFNYNFSSHTFRDGIDMRYYLDPYQEKYDVFGTNELNHLREKCVLQGFKMVLPTMTDTPNVYKECMISMATKYITAKTKRKAQRNYVTDCKMYR